MPPDSSSGQSVYPAELSQLALWPAATAPVIAPAFQVATAWLPLGWVSGTPIHSPTSFLALAALHSAASWIIDWNKSQPLFLQYQLSLELG